MMGAATEPLLVIASMAAVTYALRAAPLLLPHVERVPAGLLEYLRVVAPAILVALAAVDVAVAVSPGTGRPSLHVGIEWLGVLTCLAVVALRGSLLIGLIGAVGLVAVARVLGIG